MMFWILMPQLMWSMLFGLPPHGYKPATPTQKDLEASASKKGV